MVKLKTKLKLQRIKVSQSSENIEDGVCYDEEEEVSETNRFAPLIAILLLLFIVFGIVQHSELSELLAENNLDGPSLNKFITNEIKFLRSATETIKEVPLETQEYVEISFKNNIPHIETSKVLSLIRPFIFDDNIALLKSSNVLVMKSLPDDSVTSVVECVTTKGNLTIDVRAGWSPNGAERYLELIRAKFFENLPFFRVCPRYITQYGVKYQDKDTMVPPCSGIKDDPSLWGVRDMDFGYVFYAGSGANSRGCQMVTALCEMEGCKVTTLGSTFWEVPLGTVRKDGFDILRAIAQSGFPYPKLEMAGQHENANGPNQGKIAHDKDYLRNEYPQMEYWKSCSITHTNIPHQRPIVIDHPHSPLYYTSREEPLLHSGVTYPASPPIFPRIYVEFILMIQEVQAGNTAVETEYQMIIEIVPQWGRLGASRFLELVYDGYFTNMPFFRVIKKFVAQFGISVDDLAATKKWRKQPIADEPLITAPVHARPDLPAHSNTRGTLSFASGGPGTRSNQLFINLGANKYLDKEGFTPIGHVVFGATSTGLPGAVSGARAGDGIQEVNALDKMYSGYGEGGASDGSDGKGPSQGWLQSEEEDHGRKVREKFPLMSYIKHARIL